MTGDAVDVSVLTPVLNEAPHLDAVLDGMLAQRFDGRVEFLLVDGGSDDGSRDVLRRRAARDPRVRVLDNPARRIPQALNVGLRAARGRVVARMDAHARYPPDYLARGVARLDRGDVVSVSGPAIAVGDRAGSRRVALALATRLGVGGARFRRMPVTEVEVDSGFTGLWLRETLEAHGGWDERFRYDEDFELAARLREAGGRIVCVPEMAAAYQPRAHLRGLARQYAAYGWCRVKTSRRHPDSLRRSQVLPAALVLTAAGTLAGPRVVAVPARAGIAAYVVAVAATTGDAARGAEPRLAAALPAVLATMHVAYGVGFLAACARLGPPTTAVVRAVRPR